MSVIIEKEIQLELSHPILAEPLIHLIDQNRAHLSTFLPWVGNMQSADDSYQYLQDCDRRIGEKTELSYIIFFNGTPAGRIGLHFIDHQNKVGAIGYWLAERLQGKGIITRCCHTIIELGFKQLQLNRIEIKAAVKNTRSQAIAEKLNFKKEGLLRQAEFVNNEYLDLFLYARVRQE